MRVLDCEQRSGAWLAARRGKPTTSRMGDIVTPTGKAVTGEKRNTYMMELLAERLTGRPADHYVSAAMDRGIMFEPQARGWYQLQTGAEVVQVGFVYAEGERWGCSPDGMVGADGLVEIKVSLLHNHLKHIVAGGVPNQWQVQVQAQLWVCERAWCDFVMYSDTGYIPSVVLRVEPDPAVQDALAAEVPKFCDELDEIEADLRARYDIPDIDEELEAVDGDGYPF